jgi:dihydrofolate synthase/folylpolyglutamate synthase
VDEWLVAGIAAPRGATGEEVAGALREAGIRGGVAIFDTVADALNEAGKRANENGGCDPSPRSSGLREQAPDTFSRTGRLRAPCRECRIVAFGSFYTVAEVMQAHALRND